MTIKRKKWELNEGSGLICHPYYLHLIRAKISLKTILY